MKALFIAEKRLYLKNVPKPRPLPHEALLKTVVAGICNTDMELLAGYYGFSGIPGHEFVAQVIECPSCPELTGKRVCADINISCGKCIFCNSGMKNHCPNRKTIGINQTPGAFGQYVVVPIENLRLVPDNLSSDRAVFAEPLAAALRITEQLPKISRLRTLVLGDGKLGLLSAMAIFARGGDVTLGGRHKNKLSIAEDFGIKTIFSTRKTPREEVFGPCDSYDVVVEATGTPQGMQWATFLVRPQGTVIAKTTTKEPVCLDWAHVVTKELCIQGSRCGDISLALEILEKEMIDPLPLISARYGIDDGLEAFESARESDSIKVLIDF